MKRFLIVIALLAIVFTCLIPSYAESKPLEKVTFILNWRVNGQHAPYYLAKDKGFYRDGGIDIEIIPGKGSSWSATMVGTDKNDFGICSANIILQSRAKRVPIVSLSVIYHKTPTSIISLKESNITKPGDLRGKKIASDPTSTKHREFMGFLKIHDIREDEVDIVPIKGYVFKYLFNGKVDAYLTFTHSAHAIMAKNNVRDFNEMKLDDYGVYMYSESLITNEKMVKERPDLIKRFLRASIKGWEYSVQHRDESIEILCKLFPKKNIETERIRAGIAFSNAMDDKAKMLGIGYQTLEGWRATQDNLFELKIIERKVNLHSVYTTFLDEIRQK